MKFWVDKAWDFVVGKAWPFINPYQAEDGERVRATLHAYWSQRIERVPLSLLSSHARRVIAAQEENRRDAALIAGFEFVRAASRFDPRAFWFFDIGSAAWNVLLQSVSFGEFLDLNDEEMEVLRRIERTWRSAGADAAIAELEPLIGAGETLGGALYLYRAPLALWQERNLVRAFDCLDRAWDILPGPLLASFGESLSLMYAMLLALDGNLEAAADRLDPSKHSDKPELEAEEVRYHRARYLWGMGLPEEATAVLLSVVEDEPAYLLRFATDMAWGRHPEGPQSIYAAINQRAEALRSEIMRWQRRVDLSRNEMFADVKAAMDAFSSDLYPIFAANAARKRALARGGIEPYDPPPRFYTELERLKEFAKEFPVTFPFRTGPHAPVRFTSSDDSEMERLLALAEKGVDKNLVEYVGNLVEVLPRAVRFGILEYGQRLVNALIAEYETLQGSEPNKASQLYQWAQRCVELIPSINDLAQQAVGKEFGKRVDEIWSDLYRIESEWIFYRKARHGQAEMVVPEEEQVIERGRWKPIVCRAVDVKGTPLSAMPVVWRVKSGPAMPKEGAQFVLFEWSQPLRSGASYIRIAIPEDAPLGVSGEIEARALGGNKWYIIRYRVEEKKA